MRGQIGWLAVVTVALVVAAPAQAGDGTPDTLLPWTPPACTGIFSDVPCTAQFADWIEQFYRDGITSGCTATQYCPDSPVTRRQMAVFVERAMHGTAGWNPLYAGHSGAFSLAGDLLALTNTGTGAGIRVSASGDAVSGLSGTGHGVYGRAGAASGFLPTGPVGVFGESNLGVGVWGISLSHDGVVGESDGDSKSAVFGHHRTTPGYGVYGLNASTTGYLAGEVTGVDGRSTVLAGNGVRGEANVGAVAFGVWGFSTSGYAGYFTGNVNVTGNLTKGGGGFLIDHPQDPENRFLEHSFVESPERKNVYDGTVVLDRRGAAVIELPAYVEVVNVEFRYQLTPLGAAAPDLHVAAEVTDGRFAVAGGTPGQKVCWQVTGVRSDPWAKAHPLVPEGEKPEELRGYYLHPELYGLERDRSFEAAHEEVGARAASEARAAGGRER